MAIKVGQLLRAHKDDRPFGQYMRTEVVMDNLIGVRKLTTFEILWFTLTEMKELDVRVVPKPDDVHLLVGDLLLDSGDNISEVLAVVGDIACMSKSTNSAKEAKGLSTIVDSLMDSIDDDSEIMSTAKNLSKKLKRDSRSSVARSIADNWVSTEYIKWSGLTLLRG